MVDRPFTLRFWAAGSSWRVAINSSGVGEPGEAGLVLRAVEDIPN